MAVKPKGMARQRDAGLTPAKPMAMANAIHGIRRRRGITLKQLAAATDLDQSHLSRIERGLKTPSISTLLKIAEVLEVQVAHLFGEIATDDAITVVRADEHVSVTRDDDEEGYSLKAVIPAGSQSRMSAFLVHPRESYKRGGAEHSGEELIYVLKGTVAVEFPNRVVELNLGDTIRFDGHLRHRIRQVGRARSEALILVAQTGSGRPLEHGGSDQESVQQPSPAK